MVQSQAGLSRQEDTAEKLISNKPRHTYITYRVHMYRVSWYSCKGMFIHEELSSDVE